MADRRVKDLDLEAPHLAERIQFNEMQLRFLDYVSIGMDPVPAARKAGSKDPIRYVHDAMKNPKIKAEMDRRWQENREKMKMTRDKVQSMVLEAYEVAKLVSDPGSMVRACSELNKMSGFYEIDKSQIALNNQQRDFVNRLNELSDEELLQMSRSAKEINIEAEQDAEADKLLDYIDADYEEDGDKPTT